MNLPGDGKFHVIVQVACYWSMLDISCGFFLYRVIDQVIDRYNEFDWLIDLIDQMSESTIHTYVDGWIGWFD